MKCEYCELRRVGPFVISKACAMLSGKLINKQTDEPLKICMHHMASPGSVYEQRERLRALQITERRSSQ